MSICDTRAPSTLRQSLSDSITSAIALPDRCPMAKPQISASSVRDSFSSSTNPERCPSKPATVVRTAGPSALNHADPRICRAPKTTPRPSKPEARPPPGFHLHRRTSVA